MKIELAEQRLKQIRAKKKRAASYKRHLENIHVGIVCPPVCDRRCGICDVMTNLVELAVLKARKAGRSRNLQLR